MRRMRQFASVAKRLLPWLEPALAVVLFLVVCQSVYLLVGPTIEPPARRAFLQPLEPGMRAKVERSSPLQGKLTVDSPDFTVVGYGPLWQPMILNWGFGQARIQSNVPYQLPLRRGVNCLVLASEELLQNPRTAAPAFDALAVQYLPASPPPPVLTGFHPGYAAGSVNVTGVFEPKATLFVGIQGQGADTVLPVQSDESGVFSLPVILPGAGVPVTVIAAASKKGLRDGSASRAAISQSPDGTFAPAPGNFFHRRVTFAVAADRKWSLRLSANLPAGTALAEWAQKGQVGAFELARRLFGLRVRRELEEETTKLDIPYFCDDFLFGGDPGPEMDVLGEIHFKTPSASSVYVDSDGIQAQVEGVIPQKGLKLVLAPSGALTNPLLAYETDEVRVESEDPSRVLPDVAPNVRETAAMIWRGGPGMRIGESSRMTIRISGDVAAGPVPLGRMPQAPATKSSQPATLGALSGKLLDKVPQRINRILLALLSAIPFLFVLWLRQRSGAAEACWPVLFAATSAFFFFHLVILCAPILSFGLELFLVSVLWGSDQRWVPMTYRVATFYPFLVIGAFLLVRPVYRACLSQPHHARRTRWAARLLIFWPVLLATAGSVLFALYTGRLRLAAAIVGACMAGILLHQILRIYLPRKLPLRIVWPVTAVMLLIPVADLYGGMGGAQLSEYLVMHTFIPPVLPDSRGLLWIAIIATLGAVLLYQISYISIELSQRQRALAWFQSPWSLLLLPVFLTACYVVSSTPNYAAGVQDLATLAERIDQLLPYALLIGILILLRQSNPADSFELPQTARWVGLLLFAYYLTGRTADRLLIVIPSALGYLVFRYGLLRGAPPAYPKLDVPLAELIGRLLRYRDVRRIAGSVRRQLDKKYSAGELALAEYQGRTGEAGKLLAEASAALPHGPAAASQQIFDRGPEDGPWKNALNASFYGFFISLPFLAFTLWGVLRQSFGTGGKDAYVGFPLLDIANAFLYSASTWILTAFVFGYFFHLVRGRNGLEKALLYGLALLAPTLPVRLMQANPLLGPGYLIQMGQVFVFVIALAFVAFDLRCIRKLGYSWRDLMTVHGLGTVGAYASSIAVVGISSLISGKELWAFLWKLLTAQAGGK